MKKRWSIRFLAIALVLSLFSLPANALANGIYVERYSTIVFTYNLSNLQRASGTYISNSSSALQTEITNALNLWTNTKDPDGRTMVTLSVDNSSGGTNFGIVGIAIGSINDLLSPQEGGEIACSVLGYADSCPTVEVGGKVTSASIQLNTYAYWGTSPTNEEYDIGTVVAHEIGHLLGIAHCHEIGRTCTSATCATNVLSPTLGKGRSKTSLATYDIASYQLIYYTNFYNYF